MSARHKKKLRENLPLVYSLAAGGSRKGSKTTPYEDRGAWVEDGAVIGKGVSDAPRPRTMPRAILAEFAGLWRGKKKER